jgi:hypothetical protein
MLQSQVALYHPDPPHMKAVASQTCPADRAAYFCGVGNRSMVLLCEFCVHFTNSTSPKERRPPIYARRLSYAFPISPPSICAHHIVDGPGSSKGGPHSRGQPLRQDANDSCCLQQYTSLVDHTEENWIVLSSTK